MCILKMFVLRVMIFFIFLAAVLSKVQNKLENLQFASKVLLNIKYRSDKIFEAAGSKTQCARDLKKLFHDAVHMKRWALEMLDASSKMPSGMMSGNIFMTGNFDQCLNINHYKNETNVYGQYCTVFVTPSANRNNLDFFSIGNLKTVLGVKTSHGTTEFLKLIKVNYGLCIPHTCSIENLQNIWDYIENTFQLPVHIHFIDLMCSSKLKTPPPLPVDIYIKAFFVCYIILLLVSTWYDLTIHQQMKIKEDNIWISFSLYTNFKRLVSVQDPSVEVKYLECISGIKVLSMLWVIYGHRVMLNLFSGTINLINVYMEWNNSYFTTFVLGGVYAVDTFLVISGLLLSYGILNFYYSQNGKKRVVPYLVLYGYRFLRLSPALIAIVLFHISIFKHLSNGPFWPLMATRFTLTCYKTWFMTLSFTSNFLQFNQQCVQHSWYLAVDSQLFFLSPILIGCLLKKPLKTCLLCIAICILSGIYTFIITMKNHYGSTMFESDLSYQYYIYQPTIVRMPAWLIGFIFGYLIYKYNNIKIPLVASSFAWVSIFITMTGLILVHIVFSSATEYNALNAALYNSCAKQIWSIALGMTIFLCTTNRNGFVNRFLSWPIFRILVKITYSSYLTHIIVIAYFIGSKQHPTYFKDVNNIHDFLGDVIFTVIASIIWCLSFESPFVAIARHLYKKEMSKTSFNNQIVKKKRKRGKNKYILCVYQCDEDIQEEQKKIE